MAVELTNIIRSNTLIFVNSSNYRTSLTSSGSATSDQSLVLPSSIGSNNNLITNDGSGNLSWTTPAAIVGAVQGTVGTSTITYGATMSVVYILSSQVNYINDAFSFFNTSGTNLTFTLNLTATAIYLVEFSGTLNGTNAINTETIYHMGIYNTSNTLIKDNLTDLNKGIASMSIYARYYFNSSVGSGSQTYHFGYYPEHNSQSATITNVLIQIIKIQ